MFHKSFDTVSQGVEIVEDEVTETKNRKKKIKILFYSPCGNAVLNDKAEFAVVRG
jgi:hypothetical protein